MSKFKKANKSFFYHPCIDYGRPISECYNIGKNSIFGYQINYSGKNIPKNVENFYDKKLEKLNWQRSSSLNADGPFGNSWGYRKGDKKIIFTLKIIIDENDRNVFLSKVKGYNLSIFSNNRNLFNF